MDIPISSGCPPMSDVAGEIRNYIARLPRIEAVVVSLASNRQASRGLSVGLCERQMTLPCALANAPSER